MERGKQNGPGLAQADRRRRRPPSAGFDAFLRRAANDPDAAWTFAEVYVSLHPDERQALRVALREGALRDASHARTVALVGSLDADPALEAWEQGSRLTIVAPGAGGLTLERGEVRWSRRGPPGGLTIPLPEAVDRVSRALWAAHREGRRWPKALPAFADLFDLSASSTVG